MHGGSTARPEPVKSGKRNPLVSHRRQLKTPSTPPGAPMSEPTATRGRRAGPSRPGGGVTVGAGHVVRFRRANPDRVVRSREPAHPAIVSVQTFAQAQLLRQSRAAGGMQGRVKLERYPYDRDSSVCAAWPCSVRDLRPEDAGRGYPSARNLLPVHGPHVGARVERVVLTIPGR